MFSEDMLSAGATIRQCKFVNDSTGLINELRSLGFSYEDEPVVHLNNHNLRPSEDLGDGILNCLWRRISASKGLCQLHHPPPERSRADLTGEEPKPVPVSVRDERLHALRLGPLCLNRQPADQTHFIPFNLREPFGLFEWLNPRLIYRLDERESLLLVRDMLLLPDLA